MSSFSFWTVMATYLAKSLFFVNKVSKLHWVNKKWWSTSITLPLQSFISIDLDQSFNNANKSSSDSPCQNAKWREVMPLSSVWSPWMDLQKGLQQLSGVPWRLLQHKLVTVANNVSCCSSHFRKSKLHIINNYFTSNLVLLWNCSVCRWYVSLHTFKKIKNGYVYVCVAVLYCNLQQLAFVYDQKAMAKSVYHWKY